MESGRTSSVYSNDQGGRGTYLDYTNSISTSSRTSSFKAAKDYAESMGSSSATPPFTPRIVPSQTVQSQSVPIPRPTSTTPSTSSRPSSARPSFMNYNNGAAAEELKRKPVPAAQPQVEAPAPPREQAGQLLVFVGREIQQSTLRFVEIALQRKRFSGVAYVGSEQQTPALKQMKMDTYGVIGRLGREAGVQIQFQQGHGSEAVRTTMDAVVKGGGDVQAVICSLAYSTPATAATDILGVEGSDLQTSWESSVGFLHTVARSTLPSMIANSKSNGWSGFFLIQESAAQHPVSLLMQSTTNMLLRQLREAYASAHINIGHAANVLVPMPEPIQTNGYDTASAQNEQAVPEIHQPDEYSAGGESPTKLYSMWAMHESLGEYS